MDKVTEAKGGNRKSKTLNKLSENFLYFSHRLFDEITYRLISEKDESMAKSTE